MEFIKVGVIGIGNMGSSHVLTLAQGKIRGAKLAAICSRNEGRIEWVQNHTTEDVQIFRDEESFSMKQKSMVFLLPLRIIIILKWR